jgi:trans-aconitate methyltransferase
MRSPIYWHPAVYTFVMKLLCRAGLENKYDFLKKEIADLKVLDIGCGDCYLSRSVPKEHYSGLDINKTFVLSAQKKGLDVKIFDLRYDSVPEADVIVLSNVLHQLYPGHEEILQRILRSAQKKAVICEPMHHIASSKNSFIAWFARNMNDPGYGSPVKRLSKEELFALFEKYNVTKVDIIGREAIAVFEK